ncbi:MAG TPA: Na+/H+ antiporter subunit E [Tepidisphaeraceae bacterium]|nr:Na+/H+ antiporter subunit E [Tepidisphaeraceae bacterium]
MKLFLLNVLLALLWTFLWGSFDLYTLAAGFALGYVMLGLYSRVTGVEGYGNKASDLVRFSAYFLVILVKANLQIAYEILTPRHGQTPRIVRYPVDGLTDLQITALSNAITLTPGTLVIDVSDDKRFLYVHCMYARDRAAAIRELDDLRHRLLEGVF